MDGDGSIYVQLKANRTYRYRYQVCPNIVFFQSTKERQGLERMQKLLGIGYLRDRNDGIVEYIIGDVPSITSLLTVLSPYLKLKRAQADIMLRILRVKSVVRNVTDFLNLCALIDKFRELNYSKRRLQTSAAVKQTLLNEGLLTP